MKIQIPDYIQVLIDLLNQNGYSAYVVGGAIRNALLELPICLTMLFLCLIQLPS